jgi:hypothetical protein
LAYLLGKTVSELDISWEEFVYWQAYLRLEPPEHAANVRNAALMAQITNMSGRSLKDNSRVTIDDFLGKPKRQSMEAQIAFMRGLGDSE